MKHICTADDFRVRAIIGRMDRPRKAEMTIEEQELCRRAFRAAYARFCARMRAEGVVPWSEPRYYFRWWTCQKATYVREMKKRAKEFMRGAA